MYNLTMAEPRPNLKLADFRAVFHSLPKKAKDKRGPRMKAGLFVCLGLVGFYQVFGTVFHHIAHSGLERAVLPRLSSNYKSSCLGLQ